ncbi:hypothetical protein D3C71_1498570 [compost metagenome]
MALQLINVQTEACLRSFDQRIDDPAGRNPAQSHSHQCNNTDSYTGSPRGNPEHNREETEENAQYYDHDNRNQQKSNYRRFTHTLSQPPLHF